MFFVVLAGAFLFGITGVSIAEQPATQLQPQVSAEAVTPPSGGDGNVFFTDKEGTKHFVCPTCGMFHEVDEKTPRGEYQGKTYYLCSDKCQEVFSKDPAQAVSQMVLPANILAVSGDKLMAKCPVSGERVAVTAKTPKETYQGHQYFFCCERCQASFKKEPQKYSVKIAEDKPTKAESHHPHKEHSH
ncbi:MAG: YHS domain-containing protein [bacterium]